MGWDSLVLYFLEQRLYAKQVLVHLGNAGPLGLQLPLNWSRAGVELDGRAPGSHARHFRSPGSELKGSML